MTQETDTWCTTQSVKDFLWKCSLSSYWLKHTSSTLRLGGIALFCMSRNQQVREGGKKWTRSRMYTHILIRKHTYLDIVPEMWPRSPFLPVSPCWHCTQNWSRFLFIGWEICDCLHPIQPSCLLSDGLKISDIIEILHGNNVVCLAFLRDES